MSERALSTRQPWAWLIAGRSRLVAVLDDGVLEEFWPDAEDVDVLRMEEPRVVFSDRFWEPDWFVEKGPTP